MIRKFEPFDWRGLHEYLSQESVARFEPHGVYEPEQSRAEAIRRSGDESFFAVCLKETGKLIGNVCLREQNYCAYALGYVFNENFRGMGYATEAAGALLDDFFLKRGARRIVAFCDPRNEPSWRLLERLGFRREGHLIKNTAFKNDAEGAPVWVDTYEYGMLRDEWKGIYNVR
ncbi:MAG: GNAT family N-acetyltransferase [Defluviitaleaceae bacterium]|nr:GNAT family N-acetyltransferase [Defluviitaleaceae bacterium]